MLNINSLRRVARWLWLSASFGQLKVRRMFLLLSPANYEDELGPRGNLFSGPNCVGVT